MRGSFFAGYISRKRQKDRTIGLQLGLLKMGVPQGGVLQLRKESNRNLGTRDSATTGHCVVPVRGDLQPPRARVNYPGKEGAKDGRTTTHGAGVHPSEGVSQPLGARAYLHPLFTTRDGERVAPQGAVPSSNDGQ